MIDMDTRLRVARGIAKTETEASQEVFETLKRRGHPDVPPATVSDGWGGIDDAMVEVYGVVPEYQGTGRPPTRKQPQPGWQYLQVVKQEHGLHRTHPSHDATLQWSPGAQDIGVFQTGGDVSRFRHLGRPCLQSSPTAQDITPGGQ